MSRAALAKKPENAPAAKTKPASAALRIGEPNDSFEQEADRAADTVMAGGTAQWSLATMGTGLQRKCASAAPGHAAPPGVHETLRSPGRPLDASTRALFESRFGHDFSRVRIHTDDRAAESARAVNALAYTAGHNIAFGESQYSPGTDRGNRLLAHELTHVVQQEGNGGARGLLQRDTDKKNAPPPAKTPDPAKTPCLTSPDCAKPIPGSSWDFAHKINKEQEDAKKNAEDIRRGEKEAAEKKKQEEEKQKQAAEQPPAKEAPAKQEQDKKTPGKGKQSGGGSVEVIYGDMVPVNVDPAGPAVFLKKIMHDEDRSLLGGIWDVIVNPAIGSTAGAQLSNCDLASPKPDPRDDPDARCIDVPRSFEDEAKKYDSGAKTIAGKSRHDWMTETISVVTHEKAHFLFGKSPSVGQGHTFDTQHVFNYSPDIFQFDLGEMNSILSEFPVHFERAPKASREQIARKFLVDYINNKDEGLRGIIKKLRCIATCDEVNDGIKKVFDAQSKMWSPAEQKLFLEIVKDPANHLDWPK